MQAKIYPAGSVYTFHWEKIQKIKKTETSQNKVKNLFICSQKMDGLCLRPGKIFSFWKVMGSPDATSGFVEGRVIKQETVQSETGGGLCQLSGLLYIFALENGLQIIERHSHSVDIYKESERYSELGSDATVVYGYKDLRFKNNSKANIVFQLDVDQKSVTLQTRTRIPLVEYKVSFVRTSDTQKTITVQTFREKVNNSLPDGKENLGESIYKKVF
ncbi:MAG: VanW family protein [Leptospirales bacterium]